MSGITTTGSTILNNLDELLKEFALEGFITMVRGIGIVVIALVILPFLRVGGMQLFHLEVKILMKNSSLKYLS